VVYFQVGNLEQKHLSNLRSIHVACIAKSIHVKKYGLVKVLDRLCKDINLLESERLNLMIDESLHWRI
jgi:hypothetical protein